MTDPTAKVDIIKLCIDCDNQKTYNDDYNGDSFFCKEVRLSPVHGRPVAARSARDLCGIDHPIYFKPTGPVVSCSDCR